MNAVTEWFRIIQEQPFDDLSLARRVLDDLIGYRSGGALERENIDLQLLVNVFTAIRMDQLAKEPIK